jgi:integrase
MFHAQNSRNLSRNTIISAIPSAVSDIFRYTDVTPSVSPLIKSVKRAIRATTAPPTSKLPITMQHLTLIARITPSTFIGVRNTFILMLMFLGFLRESEAAALGDADIWEQDIGTSIVIFIFIEKSKTDQARDGHTVVLEAAPGSHLCPVMWLRAFRALNPIGSSLFLFVNSPKRDKPLAATTPNHILKAALSSINVDPKPYGSHSLRRGGVTAAVAAGVAMHVIARHGNWRSNAVFAYVSY